ncbi:MAG: TM1266 family iron-only hydrogenase system putative regulator [Fusobacteriota bacterium]
MEKRLATLSIFINKKNKIDEIRKIIGEFSDIIISRLGMPYKVKGISVIVLIIDGTNDDIGSLSGKLGNVQGAHVKTAMPSAKILN